MRNTQKITNKKPNQDAMKTMKMNSSILATIMLVFWMLPAIVMACVEIPDPLEISVSGATASPSEDNYYVLQIPKEGEGPVTVTITGSGEVPCPSKCVCDHDSTLKIDPEADGGLVYTFSHSVGDQDEEKIEWEVDHNTTPGEYKFKLESIHQDFKDCPVDYFFGSEWESNDQASDEVTIVAVIIEIEVPDDANSFFIREGEDSDTFEAKILPESLDGIATDYQWSAKWPSGVGHDPGVNFDKDDEKNTKIIKAQWYADPDREYLFEVGLLAEYEIKVSAKIYGVEISSGEDDNWVWVNVVDTGTVDPWPFTLGIGTVIITEGSDGLFYVTGQGNFRRESLSAVNDTPLDSDFYDKVQAHEEHHVEQFANIEPWASMWNVDDFYSNTLQSLPGQISENAMEAEVEQAYENWVAQEEIDFFDNQCEMEWQAFQAGNAVNPQYRNWRQADVPPNYNCVF